MSTTNFYKPGQFCWVDLMTPDVAAAKTYYGELFGWTTLDNPTDQGGVYTMFQHGDLPLAGMGEQPPEMKEAGIPAIWNSYVAVDDADAAVAKVAELGGTIEMPVMQVMDAGRMAIFSDPLGARLSVWERGEHFGAALVNEPVSFAWNELGTRDPDLAKAFYGPLFGWDFQDVGDGYWEIRVDGRGNGGIRTLGPDEPADPVFWLAYVSVADCDDTAARVSELGGQVYVPPTDIEPGRFSVVADPLGGVLAVMKIHNPE